MSGRDFKHASNVEGLRFTGQVVLPNVVQGLFRRRAHAVAIATRTGVDRHAVAFLAGLRRSYGDGPLWIRVIKDEALLLLGRESIRHALEGSPDPFAADPEPKRSGMSHFQPDALTISRNPEWDDRRQFTERVLDTDMAVHRLAPRFTALAGEEASRLPERLDWEAWNRAVRRVTRRVVLGDGAADDEELTNTLGELMARSNPPGGGSSDLYRRYRAKLEQYVQSAEPGSLVGLFSHAPTTPRTKPSAQVTHWLFALGDTLAINAFRCLALLASHRVELDRTRAEPERLPACLHEAMRLWPTSAMLSRETVRDVDWDGVRVPAGTQLLIVNTFNHRDPDAIEFADRFVPEQWITGTAGDDWTFNHFSHGPQGCPGTALAMLVGKTMLAQILQERELRLLEPDLDAGRPLPHALDYFALKFALASR